MRAALEILRAAVEAHPAYVVAFSGGTDSAVLLDLAVRFAPRPPLAALYASTGLEPPENRRFVEDTAGRYGVRLAVATPPRPAEDVWSRSGFPMLGKSSARVWTRSHPGSGIKVDCTACCRALKLLPGRRLTRELGATMQLVGTRGSADSRIRGVRARLDGAIHDADGITVATPLLGWTDLRLRWYVKRYGVQLNPVILRGGEAGCLPCGGGAQYDGSSLRRARLHHPVRWRYHVVDGRLGEVILTVKTGAPLSVVRQAIARAGGLARLADERPWLFDFLRPVPLRGYEKHTVDGPHSNEEAP